MRYIIAASFAMVLALTTAAISQTSINVAGVTSPVTITRDSRAIPYIDAKTDADLYFAQGYTMASDRLWQMDILRRVARGETAELFGSMTLEQDKRWRRFNFSKIADESLHHIAPDIRSALDSYAAGVNAYIASLTPETMPVEFKILQYRPREWRPADTVVIGKVLSDALSTTWQHDLLRAAAQELSSEKLADVTNQVTPYDVVLFGKDRPTPRTGVSRPVEPVTRSMIAMAQADAELRRRSLEMVGLYAEDLAASNNWVISGKRTADGKPLLANDPHLQAVAPNLWYLVHLTSPTVRVSGVTLPGVPGVVLGHNEHIAWGATNVGPDVQDLYVETFDAQGRYKTPSGWEAAAVRNEAINLRSNLLDPTTRPVEFEVTETRHGPIILEENGKRYALKWTAFDPRNNEIEAFFRANRAKNWKEFTNGLRSYGGSAQNFVYADVKGNIGWYAASKIPMRRTGDGALPYDGSTNDGDWLGMIPFDELPHLYNPPSGLIVTANQRVVGTSYKYTQLSRDAAAPWRARRIVDAFSSNKKITADIVRDVQYDTLNIPLQNLAKAIVSTNAASPETLAVLKAWDGRMTVESRGALLANDIRECAANRIADDNKPVPANIVRERILDRAVREDLKRWLPGGVSSFADLFSSCDRVVRADLASILRLGPDDKKWTWGRVWQSRFPHPLGQAPLVGMQFATPSVPIDGSWQTPNVGSAASMRHITSPGNWDATRLVIPLGQSGDPNSPNYKDQFEKWRTGEPAIFPFTAVAVKKAEVKRLTLMSKN